MKKKIIFILLSYLIIDFSISNILFKKTSFWEYEDYVPKYWRISSQIYHHDLMPNIDVTEQWGGKFKKRLITNSLGFRDFTNRNILKKNDKKRILLIGDSFIEGAGYDYAYTIGGLLQNYLGEEFEVLNSAVGSYSPSIYFFKTKHFLSEGYQFDYALIFLDISDIYDELFIKHYPNGNILSEKTSEEQNALKENFYSLGYFLRDNLVLFRSLYILSDKTEVLKNYLKFKFKASKDYEKNFFKTTKKDAMYYRMTNIDRGYWTFDESTFSHIKKGLNKSDQYLERLFSLLNDHNIKSYLIIYPWPTQIQFGDTRHEPYWKAFAKKNEINLVNLYQDFKSDDKRKFIFNNFIFGDIHWNKAGNIRILKALIREIDILRKN